MQDVRFGFQAAAADVAGVPDQQLYSDLMADCAPGHRLGYDAAWLLEHHFSDYYPTPGPLMSRFAEEICPRHSSAMRKGRAA